MKRADIVSVCVAAAMMTAAHAGRAEPPRAEPTRAEPPQATTDFPRAFAEGRSWASGRGALEDPLARAQLPAEAVASFRIPRLTIIARDWGESHLLVGSALFLTDVERVSRSTRAIVSRVSLGGGSVSPFVQIAMGQYRVDPALLLGFSSRAETASQLGAGVDVVLSPRWRFALEVNTTHFYREGPSADDLPVRDAMSGLVASSLTLD